MDYSHTQSSPLHWLVDAMAIFMLAGAWLVRGDAVAAVILAVAAVAMLVLGLSFRTLTVADSGQWLSVRFGPLPLFSKRIAYADVMRVEPGRSSWIDGWGIHWVPGRGSTYNLWGFDCAVLHLGNRTVRLGSDDVDNLVDFLNRKIASETT